MFFLCNYGFFSDESLADILLAFAVGFRFDVATIALFNAPILIFWALPFKFRSWRILNIAAETWFLLANFMALLVNVVDAKYFSFTLRRMSGQIFGQSAMLNENWTIYFDMLIRYWYVVVIGLILTYVLCLCPTKFSLTEKTKQIHCRDFVCFFAIMAATIVGIRGGFQRKPLKPVDSIIYATNAKVASLANNTAFNIFHTKKNANLPRFQYFDATDDRLAKFSPRHRGNKFCDLSDFFRGKNVFIIILESFSAEHVGALDRQFKENNNIPFTPFLDSLIQKSYVFDGFANGTISIDGLTSIVLGVPRLFNMSYITSAYAENAVESLPLLLRKNGYRTMFFYGGKRNSCNFDSLRSKAQIEEYYCEYDYDGSKSDINGWGVYDEEFFQFVAKKVNESQKPFLSILFTLSSHHPYLYPQRLHGKFPKSDGPEALEELIAYTDYSLRKFFETAEKMDWYKNTIFVLVADHISGPKQRYYKNSLGGYSIPLIFFDPNGKLVGKSDEVAQQIDIMPSVLDLVGCKCNYFSFGSSLFNRDASRFAISHDGGNYQIITNDFVCRFDGKKVVELYERSDFLLKKNLAANPDYVGQVEDLGNFMKAFLQQYSESIIGNDMVIYDEDI
ncbi:MAG: LTA synthase family protein [Puniceicoccales bacterium]|nr:LTA synthase family protein [Puniceicoccales bacterium]